MHPTTQPPVTTTTSPPIRYLTYRYKKSVQEVVDAPQGAASEIAAANKVIQMVLAMLPEIEAQLAQQKEQQRAQYDYDGFDDGFDVVFPRLSPALPARFHRHHCYRDTRCDLDLR